MPKKKLNERETHLIQNHFDNLLSLDMEQQDSGKHFHIPLSSPWAMLSLVNWKEHHINQKNTHHIIFHLEQKGKLLSML